MKNEKILIIFAGPNGSGKSSLANFNKEYLTALYINADDITMSKLGNLDISTINKKQLTKINIAAANEADFLRKQAMEEGVSFTTETVMSTTAKIELMRTAKANGYKVILVYVSTNNYKINIKRIQARVQMGGHPVQPKKTQKRYEKAMELMPEALQAADKAYVFDNSGEKPILVIEKTLANIQLYSSNKKGHSALKQVEINIMRLDKQFADINSAGASDLLSSQSDDHLLYNALTKEAILVTDGIWKGYNTQRVDNVMQSTDAKIYEAMVKDGFPLIKMKNVLLKNPELNTKDGEMKESIVTSFIIVLEKSSIIRECRFAENA